MKHARPPEPLYPFPYKAEGGCLFMERVEKQEITQRKLCNFLLWITGECTRTDGVETKCFLRLRGVHSDGRPLPEIEIPAAELANFNWLPQWGMDCILAVGGNVKDHIRCAVQSTANSANRKEEYAVTGWQHIGDSWEYLLPGNANASVHLTGKLGRYAMSDHCSREDLLVLKELLECKAVSREVLLPLIAYVFLSPLVEFLRQAGCVSKFVLFLVGKTGCRKSTLAALMLSFFGQFTSTELPLSFRDTANSIGHYIFLLKDVLTCIDDFHPGKSQDEKKLADTAQRIMRSYGDRQGRGRLRADASPMEAKPPQGNAILTGEHPPDIGESGTARYLALEMRETDVDLQQLSYFQRKAAQGIFQNCLYGFIRYLKEFYLSDSETSEKFTETLNELFASRRDAFLKSGIQCHGRLPETVAHLEISMWLLILFLQENSILSEEEGRQLLDSFCQLMRELAVQQRDKIEQDKPTHIFLRKLNSLLESGQAVVMHRWADMSSKPKGFVGCQDNEYYYLQKDAAHQLVSRLCQEQGESFSISPNELVKALAEEGLSVRDGTKNTKKLTIGDSAPRMIWLRKDKMQSILDEGN